MIQCYFAGAAIAGRMSFSFFGYEEFGQEEHIRSEAQNPHILLNLPKDQTIQNIDEEDDTQTPERKNRFIMDDVLQRFKLLPYLLGRNSRIRGLMGRVPAKVVRLTDTREPYPEQSAQVQEDDSRDRDIEIVPSWKDELVDAFFVLPNMDNQVTHC